MLHVLFSSERRLGWEGSKESCLSRRTAAQKEDRRGVILQITVALVGRMECRASDRNRRSGPPKARQGMYGPG